MRRHSGIVVTDKVTVKIILNKNWEDRHGHVVVEITSEKKVKDRKISRQRYERDNQLQQHIRITSEDIFDK